MNEEEKKEFLRTKEKYAQTWLDNFDMDFLINLVEKLQKENENFEKLNKDYSYSVDIVRENTRLRRQAFNLELENEKLKGQYAEYVKLTCNEVAKNSELNSESNSAIKEKNEIINKQKELIEYLRRSCDRKESCWIEEQHENVELETKLEEKDKTINAMAEYIASRDIDEDICKYINCGEGDKEREECVECVIDFFEEF